MFRSLIGFAVFAIVAVLALKLIFSLLGIAIGLLMTLLWLAFVGWLCYLVLRLVSPGTADRVREVITGRSAV